MTVALGAVLAYLALQLAIGLWISRRIVTESDYLLAGRSLGYTLATFSIFATWFGAETTIGSAGSAYREGVTLASAEPFGYGLCLIVMGLVFAVPLWRRRLTTLADLYRQRYSVPVERVAAIILVPGSILWAAAQVRAFGNVLSTTTTALDVNAAIGIAAGFTILYTAFGGLLVDAITDLLQGVLLILGLLVLFAFVIHGLGGVDGAMLALGRAEAVHLAPARAGPPLAVLEAWAIPVFGSVLATELVGRIIATRAPEVARRSSVLAGTLYLSIGMIPVLLGIIGPQLVPGLDDPEQLLPTLARELLPTVAYALFAGGLISAILSTVDSTLLIASGLLSHNLIVPLFGIEDERRRVLIARAGVLVFGAVAYVLALRSEGVYALVEQASAFGSAGAVVTVSFALFTRVGGSWAAMTTLLAGTVAYVAASFGGSDYPFLVSLATALAAYLAVAAVEHAVGRGWEPRAGAAGP